MKKSLRLFGTFEKVEQQDDGTVKVFGYASTEAVDSQGEVVKADAIRAAMPDYLKFGAVREMHKADAAGTAIEMEVKDDGRTWFGAHIVDPIAVKKVETKVYKGFSIGGKITERDSADAKIITGLNLTEISLVDRPANPEATFSLFKADGVEGAETEEPDPAASQADGVGQAATDATAAPPAVQSEAESAASPAPDASKVAGTIGGSVKKSMYDVSTLASILSSIMYLAQDAQYEADWELDNSPVPASLRTWLKSGAEILQAMAAEELAEMSTRLETAVKAAKAGNLAKAGARNSKSDQTKIQAMHDSAVDLGAVCSSEKASSPDDLKKIADAENDLAKVTGERDELKKKYDELAALPAPAKGSLKTMEKADDVTVVKTEEKELDPSDPNYALQQMRKAHSKPQLIKL